MATIKYGGRVGYPVHTDSDFFKLSKHVKTHFKASVS